MDNVSTRPGLVAEDQAQPSTNQARRSSLNFFRMVSSDKQRKTSPMLFRSSSKEAAKEEVALPTITHPRIPSFHFDAMTNRSIRGDSNSTSYAVSHNTSPRRNNTMGKPHRAQHKSVMPPIPQTPATPPAQESYDPFARTSTMTSTMTASMKDRGRYGYSSPACALPNSPRRLRRKKDAHPYK